MVKYTVVVGKTASKELEKLPTPVIKKIVPAIVSLEEIQGQKDVRNYKGLRIYGEFVLEIIE